MGKEIHRNLSLQSIGIKNRDLIEKNDKVIRF